MIDYSLQFEVLCGALDLGDMVSEPETLLWERRGRFFLFRTQSCGILFLR